MEPAATGPLLLHHGRSALGDEPQGRRHRRSLRGPPRAMAAPARPCRPSGRAGRRPTSGARPLTSGLICWSTSMATASLAVTYGETSRLPCTARMGAETAAGAADGGAQAETAQRHLEIQVPGAVAKRRPVGHGLRVEPRGADAAEGHDAVVVRLPRLDRARQREHLVAAAVPQHDGHLPRPAARGEVEAIRRNRVRHGDRRAPCPGPVTGLQDHRRPVAVRHGHRDREHELPVLLANRLQALLEAHALLAPGTAPSSAARSPARSSDAATRITPGTWSSTLSG